MAQREVYKFLRYADNDIVNSWIWDDPLGSEHPLKFLVESCPAAEVRIHMHIQSCR